MTILNDAPRVVSVSQAASRGVAGLVKDAELGADVVVERHGRPVAAVVSMHRFEELCALEADLRDVGLVLARVATDNGRRMDLDDAIRGLGFDPEELTAELAAEQAAADRE